MPLTTRKWLINPQDIDTARELSRASNISITLAQVLINRGVLTTAELDAFITPKLNFLSNPYDIPGLEKAANTVLSARSKKEKVAVYGDYDVDGVTGTSILLLALKDLGIDATYYIPHRYNEGYGMSNEAVKKLFDEGVRLIITVDCGISNFIEVEYANSLGMEVIVTDHHNPPPKLPDAYAVVDPKLIDGGHKTREMSGAGVAFKFAWGLYRSAGISDSSKLMEMFDLAGLGTIADIVPLVGENRVLAVYGLKCLNSNTRVGLKSLIEAAGIKKRITSNTVNFAIAPRLNSAGRLEHASLSVELLTTKDATRAKALAQELNKLNTKRQSIGSQIQEEVFARIGDAPEKAVILSGNSWNPGVIGIAASQVVDKYYRPAVLIGVQEGIGRGSARSIDGIDIFGVLNQCRDLFIDFGGHKKAAGFEISEDKIPELTRRLNEIFDGLITDEDLTPALEIESVLDPKEITMALASELELLNPYGEENPTPVFACLGLKLIDMRRVGDGSHLKTRFTDGSVVLDSIGFSMGELADKLRLGENYDLAYNLEVNEYNGFGSAQLNLVDIRNEEKK